MTWALVIVMLGITGLYLFLAVYSLTRFLSNYLSEKISSLRASDR